MAMKTNKLNFVVIGTGMISSTHADAIENIDRANLLGVFDKSTDRAEEFAKKYSIKAYDSYEAVLSDSSVDAVCLCTPSGFHAQQARDALENGKNVVVEKPLALAKEDCDRVIETVKKTGKTLTVICQLRFSEDVQTLKKLYDENAFGTVSLCDLYMKYWREPSYYSDSVWRGTKALDGGGALMNQGIHGVDLLLYITGGANLVSARAKAAFHDIEVEDTGVALLEYGNGAFGVIEGSTCAYPGFARSLEIHGSNGCAILKDGILEKLIVNGEDLTPDNSDKAKPASASSPAITDFALHKKQLENFIGAINGEEELLIDAYEGRKAVALITDIYKYSEEKI